jgi:hypothetical protein
MPATRRASLPALSGANVLALSSAILLGLALGGAPRPAGAVAEDRVQRGPIPGVRCSCRANGRSYEVGERACIATPGGPRLARCALVQNVTSWAIEAEGCQVSRLGAGGTTR